jgi:hypothetical protein
LKTYLKNKCAYAHKQGYLTENTNQKQGRHEDDEDEDEDDEGKGKERERDMVAEKQEQAKDGWNRGNGWGADFKGSDEDDDDLV